MKFSEEISKFERLNACQRNVYTFQAVFKIRLTLSWSISSNYLTVSILWSYLFSVFSYSRKSFILHTWLKNSCIILAQWSVEAVSEARMQYCWILPGYNRVFRWKNLALRVNLVKILIFVHQSNIHKPELDLARRW